MLKIRDRILLYNPHDILKYMNTRLIISAGLTLVAASLVLGALVSHIRTLNYESQLDLELALTHKALLDLAMLTDRNGADQEIESIVLDCSIRPEYESLLVKLGSLSARELLTVQSQFENCGFFYSERKSLMVSRIVHTYSHFTSLIKLRSAFDTSFELLQLEKNWKNLVELESKRSELLNEQTLIQQSIITLLIKGKGVNSADIVELVSQANQIGQHLIVLDHEIDETRRLLEDSYVQ